MEGSEGSGRLWKVPEGSGTSRAILESPEGSIIGAAMLTRGARSLPLGKFGFGKGG